MIEKAIKEATAGRAVYIVAANLSQVKWLKDLLREMGGDNLGISVESPTQLRTFEWETMRLRGAHPNCRILVDHYAIESRFNSMLEELHAYDKADS